MTTKVQGDGLILPTYAAASRPTAEARKLIWQTDGARGPWVSDGTNWWGITGETFNVKEFGAKGDASTDDTAAIQAALDAVASNGGTVIFPVPSSGYRLTTGLVIRSKSRFRVIGMGAIGETDSVKFVWDGANGGIPFTIDHVRDSQFANFSIVPGTGTILVGIELDQSGAGVGVSTNNKFSNIHIGASTHGVRISNVATANNDLHTFEDFIITGSGTNGYLIDHSQAKFIRIIRGIIANRTYGINNNAGSFYAESVNFSANTYDVYLQNPTDSITIISPQSEGAEKFLATAGASGSAWAVTVVGGRVDPTSVGVDNEYLRYQLRGALNLLGVDFASGANRPNTKLTFNGTSPGATVNVIGCVLPNATPFTTATTQRLVAQGNVYVDGSGNGQPLEHLIEGNLGLNQTSFGASAAKVIAIGSGTAPSTSPADAFQVWVADRGGTAGKASIHWRAEDGTVGVLGDKSGVGTANPSTTWQVVGSFASKKVTLTYAEPQPTDASLGNIFYLSVTNTNYFTMSNPTNPTEGQIITYDIKNSNGGAMGNITFDTAFLLGGSFTSPAASKRRTITFYYDGTNWVELSRAAADI